MVNIKSNNVDILYKHERTVRIISIFKNGGSTVGTGFVVSKTGYILTCWHVICGIDLKDLRNSQEFVASTMPAESDKVDDYFKKVILKIEVELPDGSKVDSQLDSYDYCHDLAVIKIKSDNNKLSYFELDFEGFDYFDSVNFTGYPMCLGYNALNSPFAINSGSVSAFPDAEIAGAKYPMIQLTSICIGGNSGAPLFKNGKKKASGLVNGYEFRYRNDLAVFKNGVYANTTNFSVPINISYATGFDFLIQKSEVFNALVKKI